MNNNSNNGFASKEENEQDKDVDKSNYSINTKLLVCKTFYFFFFVAVGSFRPYLTLLLKQLYMSSSQAGFLFGVKNCSRFFGGVLISAVADKFNKHKIISQVSLFCLAITMLAISVIPPGDKPDYCKFNARGDPMRMNFKGNVNWFSTTFILSVIILIITGLADGPVLPIADTMTLSILKGDCLSYSFQRAFGDIGYGLASFIVGVLVTYNVNEVLKCGEESEGVDYKPCLYTAAVLFFCTFLNGFRMKEELKKSPEQESYWKNFRSGLSFRVIIVYLLGAYNGCLIYFIDSFLFWYLQSLGGTPILFGTVKLVGQIGALLGSMTTKFWINSLGHETIFFISMFGLSVRFLNYVLIENPWFILLTEWIYSLIYAVFVSSGVTYIGLIPGVPATFQGMFTSIIRGMGGMAGPLLGGFSLAMIGPKYTLITISIMSIFVAALFKLSMMFFETVPNSEEVPYKRVSLKEKDSYL